MKGSHLSYSGLLLLELTESEDPSPRRVVERLLEGMQQLHLLTEAEHITNDTLVITHVSLTTRERSASLAFCSPRCFWFPRTPTERWAPSQLSLSQRLEQTEKT